MRWIDTLARATLVDLTQREQAIALCLHAPDRWGSLGVEAGTNLVATARRLVHDLGVEQARTVNRAVQRLRPVRAHVAGVAAVAEAAQRASSDCSTRPVEPGSRWHEVVWTNEAAAELEGEILALEREAVTYDAEALRRAVRPLVRTVGAPAHGGRPGVMQWAGGVESLEVLACASGLSERRVRAILRQDGGPRKVPLVEAEVMLKAVGLDADRDALRDLPAPGYLAVSVEDAGSLLRFELRL